MAKKYAGQAPKPTTYRQAHCKSKLEAQWACFLDHHKSVEAWQYEPFTFVYEPMNWEYTPDFAAVILGKRYMLEIKPAPVSAEYKSVQLRMAQVIQDKQLAELLVIVGSFWGDGFIWYKAAQPSKTYPLRDLFVSPTRCIDIATHYRFDLA